MRILGKIYVCSALALTLLSAPTNKLEEDFVDYVEVPAVEIVAEMPQNEVKWYTDEEVDLLTKLLYGEAGGVKQVERQAAVVWCVLNRVDAGYGDITKVVTAPKQFSGYKPNRTNYDEKVFAHCREVVIDVLDRYATENQEGRVLPANYLWFYGDGKQNYFRDGYKKPYNVWNWELENPYDLQSKDRV